MNNAYRDALAKAGLQDLRHLAGRAAGRVRRAGPGAHPYLRGHPGAPGAEEPPDPAAPAVRRVRGGRRRLRAADQLPVGVQADAAASRRAERSGRRPRDHLRARDAASGTERFRGPIFAVVTDRVTMPAARSAIRDSWSTSRRGRRGRARRRGPGGADPPVPAPGRAGAVGAAGRPGRRRRRGPAGTAPRELAEETDYSRGPIRPAGRPAHLARVHRRAIRIFLARELHRGAGAERHERAEEEADMRSRWVDLDEAVAMVLRGEITNAPAVAGLLARAPGPRRRLEP